MNAHSTHRHIYCRAPAIPHQRQATSYNISSWCKAYKRRYVLCNCESCYSWHDVAFSRALPPHLQQTRISMAQWDEMFNVATSTFAIWLSSMQMNGKLNAIWRWWGDKSQLCGLSSRLAIQLFRWCDWEYHRIVLVFDTSLRESQAIYGSLNGCPHFIDGYSMNMRKSFLFIHSIRYISISKCWKIGLTAVVNQRNTIFNWWILEWRIICLCNNFPFAEKWLWAAKIVIDTFDDISSTHIYFTGLSPIANDESVVAVVRRNGDQCCRCFCAIREKM